MPACERVTGGGSRRSCADLRGGIATTWSYKRRRRLNCCWPMSVMNRLQQGVEGVVVGGWSGGRNVDDGRRQDDLEPPAEVSPAGTDVDHHRARRDRAFLVASCCLLVVVLAIGSIVLYQGWQKNHLKNELRDRYRAKVPSVYLECFVDRAAATLSSAQLQRLAAGRPSDEDNHALSGAVAGCQGPSLRSARDPGASSSSP